MILIDICDKFSFAFKNQSQRLLKIYFQFNKTLPFMKKVAGYLIKNNRPASFTDN